MNFSLKLIFIVLSHSGYESTDGTRYTHHGQVSNGLDSVIVNTSTVLESSHPSTCKKNSSPVLRKLIGHFQNNSPPNSSPKRKPMLKSLSQDAPSSNRDESKLKV